MHRKLLLLAAAFAVPATLAAQRSREPARPGTTIYEFSGNHARIGVVVATAANPDTDKIGARISAVTPGGPADKAGIRAGDVITKFNGVSLANVRSEDSDESGPGNKLVELAHDLDPGDTVQVEYRRGSDAKKGTIVAEELNFAFNGMLGDGRGMTLTMPRMEMQPFGDMKMPSFEGWGSGNGMGMGMSICFGDAWCNLELVSLNSDLGDYFGTHDGVLVVKASEDSTLPLKSGDVILSIGDRKPTSPEQAMRILRSYDTGETVNVEIMRHQKRQTISWKVPDREDRGRFRTRAAPRMRSEEGAYEVRPQVERALQDLRSQVLRSQVDRERRLRPVILQNLRLGLRAI